MYFKMCTFHIMSWHRATDKHANLNMNDGDMLMQVNIVRMDLWIQHFRKTNFRCRIILLCILNTCRDKEKNISCSMGIIFKPQILRFFLLNFKMKNSQYYLCNGVTCKRWWILRKQHCCHKKKSKNTWLQIILVQSIQTHTHTKKKYLSHTKQITILPKH